MGEATRFCSARNLADANRHELCDGVASLLAERSGTLLERNIGMSLGRRVGWSRERIAVLEEERDAQFGALAQAAPAPVASGSCTQMRRGLDYFRNLGTYGEVEMARRAIARSGMPISVLAANYQRDVAELGSRQPADAASGASAASAAQN